MPKLPGYAQCWELDVENDVIVATDTRNCFKERGSVCLGVYADIAAYEELVEA